MHKHSAAATMVSDLHWAASVQPHPAHASLLPSNSGARVISAAPSKETD